MQTSGKPRLSVLVPIYNQVVTTLAQSLYQQRGEQKAEQLVEIRFLDDGSAANICEANREFFQSHPNDYEELGENTGRSAIRWALAKHAKAEFLLFLDCDLDLPAHFLKNWLGVVSKTNHQQIVTGGLRYADQPPQDPSLFLDWHYGKTREERSTAARQKAPHKAFMLSNSLIPKVVFQRYGKMDGFVGWGHEDTLFAMRAAQDGIGFEAVDNAVLKRDLDHQALFMQKQLQALDNLCTMAKHYPVLKELKLYRYAQKGSALPERLLTKIAGKRAQKLVRRPKLRDLDLWKLALLSLKLKKK